jgi:uncharacterized protein (TIGR00369 family)
MPDSQRTKFEPKNPNYEQRAREAFARQGIMQTIGASISKCAPGSFEITLPYDDRLSQQHGFLHGGIVATILDSACGFAAFTLMAEDAEILSIEFKTNFLAPAHGDTFFARGQVVKPGRTITVAEAELYAVENSSEKMVATMHGTLMTVYHHSQKQD